MRFAKVRNVKTPCRANSEDVGYDFFMPEFDHDFVITLFELNKELMGDDHDHFMGTLLRLLPFQRIRIPSGIHIDVPKNHAFIAENKTGVSYKKGLLTIARVVDPGFQGELVLGVQNNTPEPMLIATGEKLIQFLLVPVRLPELQECTLDELFPVKSSRGTGSFGSTGVI